MSLARPFFVATGQLDCDGITDVAVVHHQLGQIEVWLGDPAGTLRVP